MGEQPRVKMSVEDEVKVSNEDSDDESTDEDMPEMEEGDGESGGKGKQSRSEKKSKNILFVIKEPDVFKTSAENPKSAQTYVVFGKAEIEDLSAQATSAAVEQFKNPGAGLEVGGDDAPKNDIVDADDDGDEDPGDLDENDIELVVKQAGVTKAKAIKAL